MRRVVLLLALIAVLAVPAFAEDFVGTPVADHPGSGRAEFHVIDWNLDGPPGPEEARIFELFVGATDRFEVDLERWSFEGLKSMDVVNASYWLIKETPSHPSLVVGATNLFGAALPPSPDGVGFDHRVNPLVMSAYNVLQPDGPPSLRDPLLRLYAGYGWNWHDNRAFGGAQLVVSPRLGFAVINYQGKPGYVVGYKPTANTEVHAGFFHGQPLVHFGWNFAMSMK